MKPHDFEISKSVAEEQGKTLKKAAEQFKAGTPLDSRQEFILEWLSKEDWSAYGECEGLDLDKLHADGLVEFAHPNPVGITGVRLSEKGWKYLKSKTPTPPKESRDE